MSEPPRGHVALDLAPPRPPEKPPSPSTLRLAIHRVEGALPSSLVSPVVRVHLVDAASGYRWGKPAGQHCVFNEKDGKAFLRTKEEKQFPSAPWFAETGQSSFFRPFSTLPKKRGIQRELPAWDEAFLLQIQPDSRMAFLFEVLDATTNDSELRLSPVAWGFLHFAALKPSSRRVRAQLWSYRRQLCGRVALEENSDDIPLVVQEYIAAGIGEERPGALAAALASFLGRGRQRCPAALEFTFDVLQKPIQVEAPQKPESRAVEVASPKAMTIEGSPKAETVAEEEILGHLAPQHLRSKAEACILPEDLLWQIPSGKRGASRMAISPSSVLLAVAMVRSAGSELRIFSLASGRLYATCAGHNAPIEDLCWHSFQSREALVSPPLLIGCGGLAIVIYEVPENAEAPLGLSASYLKIHTKVTLSGLVRSVRPHPSMSTDPRCLILLAGGHFGLTLCQVSREVKAMPRHGANEAEQASVWVAHQPQMQQVPVEGHREVLCLRFSTQVNALENVYVTDSTGHIMLFQIRFDAAGVTASRVRTYAGSELLGVAIYELQIVTQQLLEGKRISSVQLSMADDWALVFSRDHVIRLVSLQRGVLKVEQKMLGIQCSNYSVRGTMSPDGAYVVCGSETGELLFWKDGQPLPAPIQVRLAGPLMDVVWSDRHHLVACCAMDENALPLLAFVGEGSKEKTDKLAKSKESGKESMETTLAMSTISTSLEGDHRRWADHWINANDNARSAITVEEKKRMKENILLRILDKKVEENQFAPRPP